MDQDSTDHKGESDIRLAASGDHAAAARLYDAHANQIYRVAYRMLGQKAMAEDVVQDIFVKLWTNADAIVAKQIPVRPWILKVTANLCIDRTRKHREVLAETIPDMIDDRAGPHDDLERKQRVALINNAIDDLPARQKMALILVTKLSLSTAEAADIMEIGERAMESLIARARRNLREKLAPHYHLLFEGKPMS